MKIHRPEPYYECRSCAEVVPAVTHPADRLQWTAEGWLCFDCVEGCDDMTLYPSETPEWDGKLLEDYLDALDT